MTDEETSEALEMRIKQIDDFVEEVIGMRL